MHARNEGATLTIPAAYLDDFRDALVHEIADGADAVFTARKRATDAADTRGNLDVGRDEDWRSAVRLVAQDGALLHQLEAATPGEDFTATADEATLAHACGAMARKVVSPRIERQLRFFPLDAKV